MRIGTRGSALALAQARIVAGLLGEPVEIVEITTGGDRGAAANDKSRWVSALERALLDGRIEVAVHSAKDVPSELADGLELVAIPRRADPRDAICGARSLAELKPGATVGTSSLRRMAQIKAVRDDIDVARCAETSTRACASSPRARSTRSCWRSPGSSGWDASPRPAARSTSWFRRQGRGRSRWRRARARSVPRSLPGSRIRRRCGA